MNGSRYRPVLVIMLFFVGSCGKNNPVSTSPGPEPFENVSKIVFVSNREGTDQIYVMHTDGSNVKKRSPTAGSIPVFFSHPAHPRWSPDGRRILFSAHQEDSGRDGLFIMDYDGRNVKQVNENGSLGEFDFMPTNGEQFVFVSSDEKVSIGTINNATTVLLDDNALRARWLPDGSRVLYSRTETVTQDTLRFSVSNLYSIMPTGIDKRALTTTRSQDDPYASISDFAISPDGSKIVLIARGEKLYVMNADGAGRILLTDFANYPVWSPDGATIFYVSTGTFTIRSMNADGSNKRDLGLNVNLYDPLIRFSKDGQQVFYYSNRSGNGELFSANTDGSHSVNLTNNAGGDFDFDLWVP